MISVLCEQVKAKSMDIPYRHVENIKLKQHTKNALAREADSHRAVVYLVPEPPRRTHWEQLPYADVLKPRYHAQSSRLAATGRTNQDNKLSF